jgi:2-polyprenyl-3-methyl-5-hydroxy-6-metoxy-1,4-benzoquinol methylase
MELAPQDLRETQQSSLGISSDEILEGALKLSRPVPGLSWLDIGCGTGDAVRRVLERARPHRMVATDLIDWLAADIRKSVDFVEGAAETVLPSLGKFDRVLMIEVLEHLDAPWTTLAQAARRVESGGCLVVTTPNIATARSSIELLVRGQLTAFRPDHPPHVTPVAPHVASRVLSEAGLDVKLSYLKRDMIPAARGRLWPPAVTARMPRLTCASIALVGWRP